MYGSGRTHGEMRNVCKILVEKHRMKEHVKDNAVDG